MSWGKANERWNHTASLMAMLAAVHSDPDSNRPPAAADYHPYMDPPPIPEAPPGLLKSLFPDRKG